MKKVILFVLTFVLVLSVVLAVEKKVYIVDLSYKDGKITVDEIMTKTGYYPDRKLQPAKGYSLELVSEDRVLYSFKFQIPLKIYTDVIDGDGEINGGVIVLNETNFALIVPYYDDAREIKIYDMKNKEVVNAVVVPALGKRNVFKWIFGFIIIFIVLFFFFFYKKKKT